MCTDILTCISLYLDFKSIGNPPHSVLLLDNLCGKNIRNFILNPRLLNRQIRMSADTRITTLLTVSHHMLEALAWRSILAAIGSSPARKGFARVIKRRIQIRKFVVQHWMGRGRSGSIELELEPCEMVDHWTFLRAERVLGWYMIRITHTAWLVARSLGSRPHTYQTVILIQRLTMNCLYIYQRNITISWRHRPFQSVETFRLFPKC